MSLIDGVVSKITCDHPQHPNDKPKFSTFSGTNADAAHHAARDAGWVFFEEGEIKRHWCPGCWRRLGRT